jgi:hypothetical protein
MKTTLLAVLATVLATSALASDEIVLNCRPLEGIPNGFNVRSLHLEISTENPEATMIMTIDRPGKVSMVKQTMDTEGTDTEMTLVTSSGKGPTWTIHVGKESIDQWTATVKSEGVDTISGLKCSVPFESIGTQG